MSNEQETGQLMFVHTHLIVNSFLNDQTILVKENGIFISYYFCYCIITLYTYGATVRLSQYSCIDEYACAGRYVIFIIITK